jgi:segregation and condensation protein A
MMETADTAPAPPVATYRGEPLLELPQDLYIPPDALEIFLDMFEGPLDLLLYLIRKHNLDVLDIPMARLTAQYLEYVEIMRQKSLELAGDYLVMAAVLIEIKSRMLLPRPSAGPQEELDPRAELVRRLLAYEQMKRAAHKLDDCPRPGATFSSCRCGSTRRSRRRCRRSIPKTCGRHGCGCCSARTSTSITASRATSCPCAST